MATRVIGPLPTIGGKRRIAPQIVKLIPAHVTYVEPFAGGAQTFFHKPRSKIEVLNDIDDEIVNFLRICQRHPHELVRLLRWHPAARRLFDWHAAQPVEQLTDVERALRFFYLQKNCWSGLRKRRTFHYCVTKPSNYRPALLPKRLLDIAERLSDVQIEHLPYEEVLTRYDRPSTFFFCDPPYVGVDLYERNLTSQDFRELAERLGRIAGKFILSINDCPESREWFRRFSCRPIRLTYTSMRQPRVFQELLFANFPLPAPP